MNPDFIVVGAGTAGCVVANRLAGQGERVLLLEAGGTHRHMHVKIPAAFPKLFKTKRDWAFQTTPQPALNGRRIFWPRGKMLGGSSSMNAQVFQWCSARDFETWRAAGAEGWDWNAMAPSLKRVDAELNGGTLREPNPLTHAFIAAAAAAEGLVREGSYNGGELKPGAWISEVSHRNGARWSAADAYLTKSAPLQIVKAATAQRILFEGARATGVSFRQNGKLRSAIASRGVILCAGAINSPQLLMLSGIGSGPDLQSHGIGVLADSPGVGQNLQDHLMFVMHFRAHRPVSLRSAENPWNLLRYFAAKRGMLASNVAEAIAFLASKPGQPVDLEIVFAPVLFEKEGLSPPSAHGFSLAPVLLSPVSRGRVTLASTSANVSPVIDPCYLSDPDGIDLSRLVSGAKAAIRIAHQQPLANESAGMISPEAESDEAIAAAIRDQAHTIYHPTGTCRMGSDRASVVDCSLRVRGVERLWVADASVMPTIPSGHPNAVVAAIADRAAGFIAQAA